MKKITIDRFILIFIIIDILFLPYFNLIIIPYSVPIILLRLIFNKIKFNKNDKEFWIFIFIVYLIIFSTFIGLLNNTNLYDVLDENIKRALQIIICLLYFFYFLYEFRKININIKRILIIFLVFYSVIGILSLVNRGLYFNLKDLLGIVDPFKKEIFVTSNEFLYRYNYIWSDPNNVAYCIQMVCFYLLINENLDLFEIYLIFGVLILNLVLTVSSGALISNCITLLIYIFLRKRNKVRTSILKKISVVVIIIIFTLIVVFMILKFKDQFINILELWKERMSNNTDGGRINKYVIMFQSNNVSLIGGGYTLFYDNTLFRPHSDHLRFIFSYGVIAYILSIIFMFSNIIRIKKYLFLVPAFMCYTLNSLIDEQKILCIFMLLLAITKSMYEKEKYYEPNNSCNNL